MGWRDVFDKTSYQPAAGESRQDFLRRVAERGFPSLGYAEVLRSPVWELCREVTSLRAEVEALRRELDELRGRGAGGP